MDAFCAEVPASGRRDGLCYRSLRCAAHFARRDLRLSRRSTCRYLGTSPRFSDFQSGLNLRLRAGAACSTLGRSNRWNVSLPFMDVFFPAGDLLLSRGRA